MFIFVFLVNGEPSVVISDDFLMSELKYYVVFIKTIVKKIKKYFFS